MMLSIAARWEASESTGCAERRVTLCTRDDGFRKDCEGNGRVVADVSGG
jgi:hypothetical protein